MTQEETKELIDLVKILLDYSNNNVIRANFVEGFRLNTIDGRLYGRYNIFGAKTFRLTSNHPNMLNMPSTGSIYAKPIKRCFQSQQGKVFCAVDFSALEDRVMANLSRDPNKCGIFTDEIDGHCLNSYYYFREEVEKILPRKEGEDTFSYVKRYKAEIENGNKELKAIRQKSKCVTFGLNYGAYPKKVSESMKCNIDYATTIFNRYHNELYPVVSQMREDVLLKAKQNGRIHLGLGCYLYTDNPEADIRTLNNACCQFWSILSLLSINKINTLIEENHLENDIEVVSSIYDSIYFHVTEDAEIIKWLNDNLIPIMTKDFLEDMIVHNEAELEVGYNWADTIPISNNASVLEIKLALKEAYKLVNKN